MLRLKLLLGLCVITPCILALSCSEPEHVEDVSEPDLEEFHHESNEDSQVKINWDPVWEDVDGSNEFVSRIDDQEKAACEAPNGLGLQNLLKQINKLLPKEEIKQIIKSYSQDPEIIAFEAFIKNPETIQKRKAIENSKDFQFLKDYSCRILYINLETYHNLASNLINPTTKQADNTEAKGIKGLLKALAAALPKEELLELYDKLMRTDDELVKAVAHLKSDEFHQLLLNVKNLPEYQELSKQLVSLGVPVDVRRDILVTSLGWSEKFDVLL